MKVPYSWLKELVPCNLSVNELAERLTMQGLSVEGIEYLGKGLEEIRVGQILTCDKHPNADRLTFCRVTDGKEEYSIVCGATNHKAGDKVALALPGVKLPGVEGGPLKKAKIRGVESFGMMCSERELGLGEEHSGIIILPQDAPLGEPFVKAAGLDDHIIEFEITPNRGDCLSVLGIAREVAALLNEQVRVPQWQVHPPEPRDPNFTIEIWDYDLCPRYCGRVVEGVKIGPSPEWMQRRLHMCGVRSINNVVDVSNYVLLEFGHPLHTFDLDTLQGRKIIVRRAKPGELIVTIDQKKRTLDETNLVIADAERAAALAGIMGGAETEVSDKTANVLIESAYFNPLSIRKTSKQQDLSTEASYRFERGTDWKGLEWACERCARLIQELAGGKVIGNLIDTQATEEPYRLKELSVSFRVPRASKVLGIHLNQSEATSILSRLGFRCRDGGSGLLQVTIPSHRGDVTREIDLIEEVARIYGYNRIPTVLPSSAGRSHQKAWRDTFIEQVRTRMVALGFMDSMNSAFIGPGHLDRLGVSAEDGLRRAIRVLNPLSEAESLLRTSLLPSILESLGRNCRRFNPRAALFEIARVFLPELPDPLRCERLVLSGGAYGPRGQGWQAPQGAFDFFDVKGCVEEILAFAHVRDFRFEPVELPFLQGGRSARLMIEDQQVGILGEVHPPVAEAFSLKDRVAVFEVDLDALRRQAALEEQPRFRPPSVYPPVSRDLSLIVDSSVPAAQIQKTIQQAAGQLLETCYLYDVFSGGRVPAGKHSLSFRLVFRSPERTLTEDEVNRQQERVLRTVERQFGAVLPTL